jgi:hypothetical protein
LTLIKECDRGIKHIEILLKKHTMALCACKTRENYCPNHTHQKMNNLPSLSFGVEIELLLGVLGPNAQDPHLDPRHGRTVLSEDSPKDQDQDIANWLVYNKNSESEAFEHIAETLKAANIPSRDGPALKGPNKNDVTCWCMVDDGTIEKPDNSSYSWVRLEVRSPALYVC